MGHTGPSTTDGRGRELLGLGALVLLLGAAFLALLVEPTNASAPAVERRDMAALVELPNAPPILPAPSIAEAIRPAPTTAVPAPAAGVRVTIDRLGIDLPLLAGDTERDTVRGATPTGAAFLLPASLPPGAGGNSYIYAHARSGMFLSLWQVRLGDVVAIGSTDADRRRYVVTEIHPRVAPTDLRLTLPTPDERVTLQTSTGPRDADPRFVVVAVRR